MELISKKKTLVILLMLLLTLILAACVSAGGAGPDWDENVLVYANLNPQGVDREAVDTFNRTHEEVQIEVRDYFDTDDTSGEERLLAEIAAGKIPDILDIGYWLPYRQLAQKGYLEDLWPYIESDPELGREALMTGPLTAAEVNGGVYMAFNTVMLHTVIGAERIVGDRNSWTIEDLQSAFASMPDDSTITDYYADKQLMFSMIFRMSLDDYVDWGTGKCSFDSGNFRSALAFVNSFPDEVAFDGQNPNDLIELVTRRQNGLQMLSMLTIGSFSSIQTNDTMFKGRTSYVGYPVADGKAGSSFEPSGRRLAISSICRNKKAAWEFVRCMLLPRFDSASMRQYLSENPFNSGFPINKADYELMRRFCMRVGSDSFGYTVHMFDDSSDALLPLSEEEVQRFENFYNSIERIDLCDSTIYNIVWEQSQPYFAKDKTLDETVDLIQRRVTLYVNENR